MNGLLRGLCGRTLIGVLCGGGVAAVASTAEATKFWKDGVTTGVWSAGNNWSAVSAAGADNGGVPAASEPVRIVHTNGVAHTVALDVSATTGPVAIDVTGAGATTNTLSITSNVNLTAASINVGGWSGSAATNGRGAINQSAGTVASSSGLDIAVGNGAGSNGAYTLSGTGVLNVPQSLFVGLNGVGTFNHSGGVATIFEGTIGALDVGTFVGATGTYNLSGTGQLVSHKSVYVGDQGVGIFNHSGGTHTINGDDDLYLGWAASGNGTYTISGTAALTVGDDFTVGLNGAGTLNIQGQSSIYIGDRLNIGAGDALNMSGGTLRLTNITRNATGTINYTGGTILLSDGYSTDQAGVTEFFGASPSVPAGKTLAFEGIARISTNTSVNGGALAFNGTVPDSFVTVGAVGQIPATLSIINGGDVVVGSYFNFSVGDPEFGNNTGAMTVSGAGSTFTTNAILQLIQGSIAVNNGATLTNNSSFFAGSNAGTSTTTVSGAGTTWTNAGDFSVGDSVLSISSGAVISANGSGFIATSNSDPGSATVTGSGTSWSLGGNLAVGNASAVGTLNVQNQATVSVEGQLSIANTSSVVVDDSSTLRIGGSDAASIARLQINAGTLQLIGNHTFGADPVLNHLFGVVPVISANEKIVIEGTATVQNPLTLDGGTLRVGSLAVASTFQFRGGVLEVAGGPITGLGSLVIPNGGEFRASGAHTALVAGDVGSTITAIGNLSLGNAGAFNGFGTLGTVNVGANTVTLLDANDVVFDSLALAMLGNGASAGTLVAANGLTLDFGGNIAGFGTVNTPNNLAKPLINNGHVTGNSGAQRITLPGYVKGVGTFDNVNFTGTFAPGFSPALTIVGSITLMPTSTLIMELGGTNRGGQYDAILASGALGLGGVMNVALIDGFAPSAGQSFDLFDWATLSGTFLSLNLPALSAGLTWNTSQLYTSGVLSVGSAPTFTADFDQDGDVDGDDLMQWQGDFGANALSDADDDGDSDGDDFLAWQRQLGGPCDRGRDYVRS